MAFDRLTTMAEQALAHLKVKSALNPVLWLCALCLPAGVTGALLTSGGVQHFFLGLIGTPIVLFIVAYIYFMLKSPDKLRSEEYELKKYALSLIEEKGVGFAIAPLSVEAIANFDYRDQKVLSDDRGGA